VSKITLNISYKNGADPLVLPFFDKNEDKESDKDLRLHQAEEWRHHLTSLHTGERAKSIRTLPAYRSYRLAA
jgi:hypothetical protein